MQYHAWTDRKQSLDMADNSVIEYFNEWIHSATCPWYIQDQYLKENKTNQRGGAGPSEKNDALDKKRSADGASDKPTGADLASCGESGDGLEADHGQVSDTEHSSEDDGAWQQSREASVLKMLYRGNVAERDRYEERMRKGKIFNAKHSFYRHTRCTSVAQEESSALPSGVLNVNEDTDDDEAFIGDEEEIEKEMDELRAAKHWVNQEGWDLSAEAHAMSTKTGQAVDFRFLRSVMLIRPSTF